MVQIPWTSKTLAYLTWTRNYLLLFIFLLSITLLMKHKVAAEVREKADDITMAQFAEKSQTFALDMMNILRTIKPNENVVFSPFSVQTCTAMARVGATGETAAQIDHGLGLVSTDDLKSVAENLSNILTKYVDSNILKIANKIYIMEGFKVKENFNEILSKKFYTTAEELNFSQNIEAAKTINDWVMSKTNDLITNLITPDAIDSFTRLVFLNAIHFKGEWVHKFRKASTHAHDFYLNDVDMIKVQMMSQKEHFAYADLDELDAKAIELPYKDSDLTMLIILPNSRTGLENLLKKLPSMPLSKIKDKMYKIQVLLKIPKFKAEFQIEMKEAFQKLGMTRMFTREAEFQELLDSSEEVQVSKIIHKAFIDVNEEGTEAAAATGTTISLGAFAPFLELLKTFIAERPFHYRIHSSQGVQLFFGNVVK